jgi:photosystem II stability/assembly factor-like uncharacterized protein
MSESFKGQYAPELYNEEKRYYLLQAQEFANLTDAELRDMHQMSNTFTRRIVQTEIGDSAVKNGFKISEHPSDTVRNFLIQGGDGSLDDPGVVFLKGYRLSLRNSIGYKDQTSTGSITGDAYTQTTLPALTDCSGSSHDFYGVTKSSANVIVVGSDSIALKSSDIGRNFEDVSTFGTLYGTTFSDSTIVYGVGFDGTDTVVARSMNTGNSWWNLVGYSAFNPVDSTGAFYGVSFINQNVGYIVGSLGQIYKTNDGPSVSPWPTFTKQTTGTTNILRAIDFFDAANIWVVGDNQTILYSSDGLTWSPQSSIDGTHFTGVSVIDTTTVVVCGNNGYIQKTTDGGFTWTPKSSDTQVDLNSVCFVDSNYGWAVGNNGVVTHSVDGGNTWDATLVNSAYNFKSVFFSDATTGFIVGNSGAIYRTVNGTVWDLYRTDYAYVDFHLAEVSGDISSGADYIDSTLVDPLIGLPSANRLRIVQDIKVSEGWPTPSDYTTAGPDGTAIQHYTYTLAKIHRPFDSSMILNADIVDARKVVRTVEELDYALKNGGVDASSLASGSITPDKLDPGADYTMGSLQVWNDSTIGGNLRIQGTLSVDSTVAINTITSKLIVHGSSSLGDSTRPYDSSTVIYGPIIQSNDTSRSAFDLHSYSTTINAPVIKVQQDGSGSVLKITQTGISPLPLMDITSSTTDYDISIDHNGYAGGIIRSYDDSTKTSYLINKNAIGSYAPVLGITTNAYGPTINIQNTAIRDTTSINIDQSSGSALYITARNDTTSIVINSSSNGTDLKVNHTGTTGYVLDATSSGSGIFNIRNTKGPLGTLTQKAAENLFVLIRDSTGSGRTIEINHAGIDPAIQINNDGSGIGLHVSHVGGSSNPAVDVYVAGSETGPAIRIRKANNDTTADVGQALYIANQGFSQSIQVLHDNTDSTSSLLDLANYSKGYDASALNWHVDKSGNFVTNGDLTSSGNIVGLSAYNTGHLLLGLYHFWVDTSGCLRINNGAPASDFDGTVVGTQS